MHIDEARSSLRDRPFVRPGGSGTPTAGVLGLLDLAEPLDLVGLVDFDGLVDCVGLVEFGGRLGFARGAGVG